MAGTSRQETAAARRGLDAGLPRIWQPWFQQAFYRRILDAYAHPGRVLDVGDLLAGDAVETHEAVLACLCDRATTVADPGGLLDAAALRMAGSRAAAPGDADFVFARGEEPPEGFVPRLGTVPAPEEGATVVVAVTGLAAAVDAATSALRLVGPGIAGTAALRVDGLAPAWLALRDRSCATPPPGFELILAAPDRIAAIPRSSRIVH